MIAALASALALAGPAAAQEPLVLRIRVAPDPVSAREAVWARSQARARAAIASVCTGCLGPWHPPPAPAADARATTLAGLEADPHSGASDPTHDRSPDPTQPSPREDRP